MSGFGEPLCNLYMGNKEEYKRSLNALNPHTPVFSYNLKDIENRNNLRLTISYSDDVYRFVLSRNRKIIESVYLTIPYSHSTVVIFGSEFDTANTDYKGIKLKQFDPGKELTIRGTSRFVYGTYRSTSSVDVLESIRCHNMVNFLEPLESRILYINNNTQEFIGKVRTGKVSNKDIKSIVETIRKYTDIPVAVGFGISTPEQAKAMAAVSDGAIVGSAIVKQIGEWGANGEEELYQYVHSTVEAVGN